MKGELQIPLLIPISVILIGSLFSMFNAQVPLQNSLALIVDMYLFIFFIVLYNIIVTKRDLKFFILFWLIFAALHGCFMSGDFLLSISKRSIGTFLNPNMASSYIGLSFFLLFQPYVKISKFLKWLFGIFILGGMLATKSLAGFIGFLIVAMAVMILYWYRARNFSITKLSIIILIIAILALAVYPRVAKIPNLFSRFQKAHDSRISIWKAGLDTLIKNPLGAGIGPAGFKEVGPEVEGPKGVFEKKELHSDWLSFLVERGIFGFLGIVMLFGAIAKMLIEIIKSADSNQEFLWMLGLIGMFLFSLSFSFTHEVLHFRHVWCSFALIAVEYKLRKKNQEESRSACNRSCI
ncbi:O-antigen ligase family protein [Candidatus Woesearchaeota archaeon]|nr:O-antigen ligase family protein [Candidatus Woesearchaeota archaeon]